MKNPWPCAAALTASLFVLSPLRADYTRRTPIVEAVQKTRAAIVTVKVETTNRWGQTKEHAATGVIVDERGWVLTNQHVVAGADKVRVRTFDDTELMAQVLVADAKNDLAVLRIKPEKKLQALPLGPASDLMVGETVIAVGHPFGYANTVSRGIISGLGRQVTLPSGDVLSDLIQTDAGINPGNSGGPLLNLNGELIGLNCALREGAHGISFAINADTMKQFLNQHMSGAKIAGVRHGLTCTERVLEEGPNRQRVVVTAVAQETPAASAGLQRGDEILRLA